MCYVLRSRKPDAQKRKLRKYVLESLTHQEQLLDLNQSVRRRSDGMQKSSLLQ
jgi:hypothetical protein